MSDRSDRAPGVKLVENQILRALAARYCWDMDPKDAPARKNSVILRVMDLGAWDDLLDLEKTFGAAELARRLRAAPPGALRPRSWTFWHYRLGLADSANQPPAPPERRVS